MSQLATSPPFLGRFRDRRRALEAGGPEWLGAARRAAYARFDELGLPTTRMEAWRATNVAAISGTEFEPAPVVEIAESDLPDDARLAEAGPRLVFVNGRFDAGLSATEPSAGVWLGSLRRAIVERPDTVRAWLSESPDGDASAFAALNAAMWEDGAVVHVSAGAQVEHPIQLVFISGGHPAPTASFPRSLIVVEDGARVQVCETHCGLDDGVYVSDAVTDATVGDGAALELYRQQLESPAAFHISRAMSRQGSDSRFASCRVDLGATLVRNDVTAVLDGEGAHCRLDGLYLTSGKQHVDNHTVLDHARPHGDSRELYKGILTDASRAIFNGRIIVRQDAQKTDAKQSNPNLILSDRALAQTRPQLEIYADDVKCTHGATVGRLDEAAVFYLRSRGLTRSEALGLMIRSFAGEVLDGIQVEAMRERLERLVERRLADVRIG